MSAEDLIEFVEYGQKIASKLFAGVRQFQTARQPVKESYTEFLFEMLDLMANRRGSDKQIFGRLPETQSVCSCAKRAQCPH